MTEEAIRFGDDNRLVGIVTSPARDSLPRRAAVVLCGAGIVHRVGPHRLYVKLARTLAATGFTVLRFDFSGIGDSRAHAGSAPLDASGVGETQEAMNWLQAARNVDRFVLIGICSGAGFSFRTACIDRRVFGLSVINPAGHRWGTAEEMNRTMVRHYWRMTSTRAFRGKNLRKLLTLNVDRDTIARALATRLRSAVSNDDREPPHADRIAREFASLLARDVRVLLVYSEGDEGLDYYDLYLSPRLAASASSPHLSRATIAGANHTFTLLEHQARLLDTVRHWLDPLES
jgi:alpha-beta hydrolase superfamily lysophospholipase